MGEILLCVDTIQAELVIVDEVDEEASCTNSGTGKIDDDIFNGLEKNTDYYNSQMVRVPRHFFNLATKTEPVL